jgi:hypothetical protein
MAGKAHPGFHGAAESVARKEGVSMAAANRIIGYGKAHASAAARKKNPRLNRTGHRSRAHRLAKKIF